MIENNADVVGMADWLADLITSEVADQDDLSDFVISLGEGKLGVISPEGPSVYLVTVEAAEFVVTPSET